MNRVIFFIHLIFFYSVSLHSYELNFNFDNAKFIEKIEGMEIYEKPDGTIITKHPDKESAVFRDKTRITKYSDGKREIFTPDGIKIIIDYDSTTKYIYPDGKEKIISMDGKTPYGLSINDLIQVVRAKHSAVEIIYSSMRSDDIPSPYMISFYKEIIKQVNQKINNIKYKELKIIISNCRFSITGYCRRKNKKELAVLTYKNNDKEIDMEISIDYNEILSKNGYIKLADETVNKIIRKK